MSSNSLSGDSNFIRIKRRRRRNRDVLGGAGNPIKGFIDDNGVTSFIDDNSITSFTDDLGH